MHDRQTESWRQEFSGEAVVGELTRLRLEILPDGIISWKDFKETYPERLVLSRDTGFDRLYWLTPYYGYESDRTIIYLGPPYFGLPALERVAAIDMGAESSLAVPFSVLEVEPVVHYTLAGQDLVVLFKKGTASMASTIDIWSGRGVGIFDPNLDDMRRSFFFQDGKTLDRETGSTWNILVQATSGPQEGAAIRPIAHRAQFWFSRQVFRPDTLVYEGEGKASPIKR